MKFKGTLIISIYDSGYGFSIMLNGKIYLMESKVANRIWKVYRKNSLSTFYEFLKGNYPCYHIIICENGDIWKFQEGLY